MSYFIEKVIKALSLNTFLQVFINEILVIQKSLHQNLIGLIDWYFLFEYGFFDKSFSEPRLRDEILVLLVLHEPNSIPFKFLSIFL